MSRMRDSLPLHLHSQGVGHTPFRLVGREIDPTFAFLEASWAEALTLKLDFLLRCLLVFVAMLPNIMVYPCVPLTCV